MFIFHWLGSIVQWSFSFARVKRYIRGCCGFEAYHIRAISEELRAERGGKVPKASEKHELWGGGLVMSLKPWLRARLVSGLRLLTPFV